MKRITFLITMFCLSVLNTNAQTFEEPFKMYDGPYYIPKECTLDGKVMLYNFEPDKAGGVTNFAFLDEDFSVWKELSVLSNDTAYVVPIDYFNYDSNTQYNHLYVTQTLFNNDGKMEFFVTYGDNINNYFYEIYKRFEIINEDGEVLFSIPAEMGRIDRVFRYNGKDYLMCENKVDDTYDVYAINKDGGESRISKVRTLSGISASPVFAPRNCFVNVEIDEALASDGGELVIVDNSGRIVAKQPFESGQTTVPVFTGHMRAGVYNITLNTGAEIENARIIVK